MSPDSVATVDRDTGRIIPPPEVWGWGVRYGGHGQHRALFLERARAERAAVRLRGRVVMLFAWPLEPSEPPIEGVDWSGAV